MFSVSKTQRCIDTASSPAGAASSSDEATSDPEEQQVNGHERPHLRFQITSEDGFSVEADTIEGE